MGTQAPLCLFPSRNAYADLQYESTKRFNNNTGMVLVSAKKNMSPLQQSRMEDKFKGIYMDVKKPSSMQTWWRSVA